MLDHRGRLLLVTVGPALLPLPDEPAVRALHGWLDTWRGIGDLEGGTSGAGGDLQSARATAGGAGGVPQWEPLQDASILVQRVDALLLEPHQVRQRLIAMQAAGADEAER